MVACCYMYLPAVLLDSVLIQLQVAKAYAMFDALAADNYDSPI